MSFVNGLLKVYAYLFHLALCGFLLVIAILARTGNQALRLEMLPFSQGDLISRISLLSLVGFICILLAFVRIYEFVFPLWSLAVVVILIWGFVFTSYSFGGVKGLQSASLLVFAAILALYGSIWVMVPKRRKQW